MLKKNDLFALELSDDNYPGYKYQNANNCYFKIYEQDIFHAQLSWA